MGAYVIFYPAAQLKMLVGCFLVPISAAVYLTVWFLFQLVYSGLSLSYGDADVAWLAHVGGFAFGMGIAYLVKTYNLCQKQSLTN